MSATKEDVQKVIDAIAADTSLPQDLGELPAATLQVKAVDVSGWVEFPERFFKAPEVRSTIMFVQGDDELRDRYVNCSYFSVVANTAEDAVAQLRPELLKVLKDPRVHLYSFLARPSTIEVLMPVKGTPNEQVTEAIIDLGGPKKLAKKYAAFCFLFAEITCGLTPSICKEILETDAATREGEVGKDIS